MVPVALRVSPHWWFRKSIGPNPQVHLLPHFLRIVVRILKKNIFKPVELEIVTLLVEKKQINQPNVDKEVEKNLPKADDVSPLTP